MLELLDEVDAAVDNELPSLFEEFEEDMATVQQVNERVERIETTLSVIKWMVGLLLLFVVPATIGAISFGVKMGERVSYLEGQKGDPLAATIKGIETPGSKQKLDANLALLVGQIRVDQANGKKPKVENIAKISDAVKAASVSNPDDPEVWRTAAHLINFKFQQESSTPSSRDCLEQPSPYGFDTFVQNGNIVKTAPHTIPNSLVNFEEYQASDCTIHLDDDGKFYSTVMGKDFQQDRKIIPNARFYLTLKNVRVVYAGGRPLPFNRIDFSNCTFETNPVEGVPSEVAKSVTTQLLAASPMAGRIEVVPSM